MLLQCAPGAYCDSQGTQTCRDMEVVGGPCQESTECLSEQCDSTTKKCLSPGKIGSPCVGTKSSNCSFYLTCDAVTKKCVAPPPEGQPCDANHYCSGAYCKCVNSPCTQQVCVPLLGPGEKCSPGMSCVPGYRCALEKPESPEGICTYDPCWGAGL